MSIGSEHEREITGPGVWAGQDLNPRTDWIQHFDAREIDEIDTMVRSLGDRQADVTALGRSAFNLPLTAQKLESIRADLEGGKGFALVRGLPVQRYSTEQNRLIFWALALLLGDPQAQDAAGNRIHSVTNTMKRVEGSSDVRSYQTDDELTFHNDGGDAFMLLCLKTAKSGGMSKLVSVEKLFNEVLKRRPDLIEVLQQPFYFDTREQHPTGLKVQTSPILNFFAGRLSALYKRRYLLAAQRFPEVPRLTTEQEEAVQLVETICNDPDVQLAFYMEPGDVQIANNYAVLHSRTKYQDYDEVSERRHLFRAWLTLPNGRPLPPAFELTREFRTSYLSRHAAANPGVE